MSSRLSPVRTAHGSSTTLVYRRRHPERMVLYRLVQQHLASWLAARREADPDGVPIPRHVERELRGYLERGILAHLGEPTTPPALAPRARDPPVLDAGFSCAFDQSPWWDSTAAASEPSFHFDQTLN